jgi:DNA-binding transcriptional regulator/RsmH inhibitor MraZ
VVGLVDHLEIWSAEAWREHNHEIDAGAEEMAEEVARRTTGGKRGDG